mmetsp:Transcript_35587/g.79051  ORF Transcript_35587/g.79051 Transcript_35587/m.79051 type:complete len:409 (+) Transcript_35587:180-1406(+)|eukprot:CAMPEP_0202893426 /NCGR_PEP_ID=MMETSP1392-20130828/3013_1 /ASSEMBLY_ACC=CAM_ASM_000868 /TAXON_ID=225041 /ORGANISM="Chlamydomonas chlamydogama, Strain SAG 11-48b" /LENGTH=408 /DNA_ID=CAMNT_0049577753 /DNA_START=156 /DNA_END=1382 /DNA_ORIENTATION=-
MDDRPRNSLGDEDFDYNDDNIDYEQDDDQFHGTARSTVVQNQPHDEEVALSDTGSYAADDPPVAGRAVDHGNYDASLIESHDMDEGPMRSSSPDGYTKSAYEPPPPQQQQQPKAPPAHLQTMPQPSGGDSQGDNDEAEVGGYNAMEFKNLNVSDEIRELFKYIGRYKPHNIDLETKLKPFIPDYIPSVGGIDEFIKVPRPDGKPDFLGLKVLDEPAARQSDPTVLTLQLRQLSKEAPGNKAEMIGRIEHTDENKVKKVQQWISSINDIHKNKPAATVSYSRKMPDIEALMQEWPPELEAFLKAMKMPSGDLDLDLKAYTKLVCGILDIPIYENPIESLHVLFTLYLEFKSNPIFKQQLDMDRGFMSNGGMMTMTTDDASGWRGSTSAGGLGLGGIESTSNGANVMTFN